MKSRMPIVESALMCAKMGWLIIPVYGVIDGKCTCGNPDCPAQGKHPIGVDWQKRATKDPEQIKRFFAAFPGMNFGIVTGKDSGIFVVDIDNKEGKDGFESLRVLELENDDLPETVRVITGSGGMHIFFRYPEDAVIGCRTRVVNGIDIRGDGGFVVAAASLHKSGGYYDWDPHCHPDDTTMAKAPQWSIDLFTQKAPKAESDGAPVIRQAPVELLNQLMSKCDFIRRCWDQAEEISRDEWRAMLSNVAEIRPGGWDLAHQISARDPKRYRPVDTEKQLKDVLNSSAPILCETIRSYGGCSKDCGVKCPIHLLQRFLSGPKPKQTFKAVTGIVEQDGVTGKIETLKDGKVTFRQIASFTINPKRLIKIKDKHEEWLETDLITPSDSTATVKWNPEVWVSQLNFLRSLPGLEYAAAPTLKEIQDLKFYVSGKEMDKAVGYTQTGFSDGYFVTMDGAISKDGFHDDHMLVENIDESLRSGLLKVDPATPAELAEISEYLFNFNEPDVVLPMLGWTVACFFKDIIKKSSTEFAFALLNIEGEAGSGKTISARKVILGIWAVSSVPRTIGSSTAFTIMRASSQSNAVPLILDEFSCEYLDDRKLYMMSNVVNNNYNGASGDRGQGDLSAKHYSYDAPMAIIGESGFSAPSAQDRMVKVFTSRTGSKKHEDQFDQLVKLPLGKLGRLILDLRIKQDEAKWVSIFKEEYERVGEGLSDRPRLNAAIVRFGLRVLGEIFERDFDYRVVDKVVRQGIVGDGAKRLSTSDKIIQAMALMSRFKQQEGTSSFVAYEFDVHLEEGVQYKKAGEMIVHLDIEAAYPLFVSWAKKHGWEGALLSEDSFKRQLRNEKYFIPSKGVRIGARTSTRFVKLDVGEMLHEGIAIYSEWGAPEGKEDEWKVM